MMVKIMGFLRTNIVTYYVRKFIFKAKLIIENPSDWKYTRDIEPIRTQKGIVILSHESNRLGASLLAENIAKEMKRQGKDICILSRQFGELNSEYSKIAPLQIFFSRRKFRKILVKIQKLGYDRILVNTSVNGDCTRYARDCGFKVVSLVHEMPRVIRQLRAEAKLNELVRYSDFVILPTMKMQEEITKEFGFSSLNLKIKPQGIYLRESQQQEIEQEKIKNKTRGYSKIVVGVGNTTSVKGFDYFLEMSRKAPAEILFVWAGKKESFYDTCIAKNKPPKNFVYLGKLTDANEMTALYTSADVLAMTSRVDTFPSVVLEAMKFGAPVIGFTESGGVSEVVKNRVNGALINAMGDTDAFLQAIINIIRNPNRYRTLSENAKKTAVNYSFENYVRFLIGLFD